MSLPGQWKEGVKRLEAVGVFVFDQGRKSWQRSAVCPLKANQHLLSGYHNGDCRRALSRM
jgi:hypothetical protein